MACDDQIDRSGKFQDHFGIELESHLLNEFINRAHVVGVDFMMIPFVSVCCSVGGSLSEVSHLMKSQSISNCWYVYVAYLNGSGDGGEEDDILTKDRQTDCAELES